MKHIYTLLSLLFFIQCSISQDIITRELSNFNSLYAKTNVDIVLVPSSRNFLEVKIIEGSEEDFITNVQGEKLTIEWYSGNWFTSWFMENNKKAEVRLYFNKLNKISVDSDAKIKSNEPITNETFLLDATDGGKLQIIMGCDLVTVNATSGGSVTLKGEANEIHIDVSSGAEFWGAEFNTNNSVVTAASGSSAVVYSKHKIDLKAGSGATIKYRGDPPEKKLDGSLWGGGIIKQL